MSYYESVDEIGFNITDYADRLRRYDVEWKVVTMISQKTGENKPITIYDIAKEAGVSPSTVSRVLTNSANVRSEKRDKVLALIEKYNFKPNALAKGLADTKTRTIGVLAADIRNPYYASLYVAIEKAARETEYTVVLVNSLGDTDTERELLGKLLEQRVDAIIQLGGRADDLVSNEKYVELINQVMSTTPVIVTGKLDGTRCNTVRLDSMQAMELLMEHLLELGHEKIALIGGRRDVLATFEKIQRYKQILSFKKIEFDPELIAEDTGYDFESGYQAMKEMLIAGKKPTAVIAINDFSAMGIMKALEENGLNIPEDVSVVSYDNTYMAEMAMPPLTSVDYNYNEYGKKLIDTAVGVIEGKKINKMRMVNPTLVVRGSSGPVKM